MTDIKSKVQTMDPNLSARPIEKLIEKTGNIYEALAIITKRARQLNMDIKKELHSKLEEFAIVSDTIEEVQENKEQIEISKFYERLPNPTIIAFNEFLNEELEYEFRGLDENDDEESEND
ncbi:MAG: DNA-directed RNA polymerase subunit omega [Saprospiraceae bacterium]|nr:DNA-directed RNA polymerase subunit omega [Saprospiraceae bacterium]